MPDHPDGEHSEHTKPWLDVEWEAPKPDTDDDRSIVQAFIDKLSRAIEALRHREKK
jgi:hypothetical protein